MSFEHDTSKIKSQYQRNLEKMDKEINKIPSKSSEGEEEEEDEEEDKVAFEGTYDPSEYESLNVSTELKNIFSFITCYSPQMIELDTKLIPFIPDFIPAVGDIDAFIKVLRPDKSDETLGLTVLDEPNAKTQSDPTLLSLKLKAISKDIKMIDESETVVKNATSMRDIDSWVQNIRQLHETTASTSTSVTLLHSHRLPDVEQLMQEWNEEFESALTIHSMPSAELDCTLDEYVSIICTLLDIPVYSSKIASLHLLFNLYNEFRNSQHFKRFC